MIAGECGLVETIVDVMKTHINNVKICVSGCGIFWNISTECIFHFQIIKNLGNCIHRYQSDQSRRI